MHISGAHDCIPLSNSHPCIHGDVVPPSLRVRPTASANGTPTKHMRQRQRRAVVAQKTGSIARSRVDKFSLKRGVLHHKMTADMWYGNGLCQPAFKAPKLPCAQWDFTKRRRLFHACHDGMKWTMFTTGMWHSKHDARDLNLLPFYGDGLVWPAMET